jgi:hypothetical protein
MKAGSPAVAPGIGYDVLWGVRTMKKHELSAICLALTLGFGCSPADGDGASEGDASTNGGSGNTDETSGDSSGADTGCVEGSDFSGPQLRDCDLPGACGACMEEKACASFLFRCAHNADCVCAAECVAQAGVAGTDTCLGQCDLTESPPGFAEWVKGASDMCWDEGCGTLGEPPPDPEPPSGGNPGAGTDPDCAFDPDLEYDPCGAVLQLESEDKSLCARVERRNDGAGDDANTHWTLLDMRVGPLGQVCHADEPADLCWFSSHHNFAEWLHVSCGDLHYELNIGTGCGKFSNPDSTFRLHVSESASTDGECPATGDGICPIVAPMDLFPVL